MGDALILAVVAAAIAALRVVSVSPAVTEDLFAIGAGPNVVAIDAYARRPKAIAGLPRIGGVYDVNIERVLARDPSLVIYQQLDTPALESMRRTDVRVERVPGQSLADDWTAIERLGELTGRQPEARRLAARLRARLDRSAASVARKRRLRVLLLLWPNPIWSVGRGSFVDDLLARVNLINVVRDAGRPWPMLSPEVVAQTDPDVILVDSNERFVLPKDRVPWSLLTAVRTGRIAYLREKLDCGPYVGDLLDEMIRAVAPYR